MSFFLLRIDFYIHVHILYSELLIEVVKIQTLTCNLIVCNEIEFFDTENLMVFIRIDKLVNINRLSVISFSAYNWL